MTQQLTQHRSGHIEGPTQASPSSNLCARHLHMPAEVAELIDRQREVVPIHEDYVIQWDAHRCHIECRNAHIESYDLLVDGRAVGNVYLGTPQNCYVWQTRCHKSDTAVMPWIDTLIKFLFAEENRYQSQGIYEDRRKEHLTSMQELLNAVNCIYAAWQRSTDSETYHRHRAERDNRTRPESDTVQPVTTLERFDEPPIYSTECANCGRSNL